MTPQQRIVLLAIIFLVPFSASGQYVPEVDSLLKARKASQVDRKEDRKAFSYFNVELDRKYGDVKTREQIVMVLNDPEVGLETKILFADFIPNTLFNTQANLDSLIDTYVGILEDQFEESDDKCRATKFLVLAGGLYGYNKRYAETRAVFDRIDQEVKNANCTSARFLYYLEISNNLYEPLGNTSKAVESHIKALNFLDSMKRAKVKFPFFYELDAYNEFASLNYHTGNWRQAIAYWKRSVDLIEKSKEWDNYLTGLYNNIGISYRKLSRFDSALYFLNKCIDRAKATNDGAWIGIGNGNIGDIYADQKRYDEAIPYLEEDVRRGYLYYQYGSVTTALGRLGICYQGLQQQAKARSYYDSALATFKRWPNPVAYNTYTYNVLLNIYRNYASLEFEIGEFEKAFMLQRKGEVFDDSLKQLSKRQEIATLQTYHAFEKRESENKLLKAEIGAQKLREFLAIVIIIAIAGAIVLVWRFYQLRIQKLRTEMSSTAEINRLMHEQAEEQILLKERELSSIMVQIQQKNELMSNLKVQLGNMAQKKTSLQDEVKSIYKTIRKDLDLQSDWEKFKLHFEKVHPDFFARLSEAHPDLSLSDLRICAYLRINMDNNSMSQIHSLRVRRHRLRKRVGFLTDKELYSYLVSI